MHRRLQEDDLPRDPALTYNGALQILGRYERPQIEKLDRLLGGVILGAGAAAGAAALAGPTLAPMAALAAVWSWIEQKNEAFFLLRKMLDAFSNRLMRTGGYERRQLITAAHTVIVAASFYETLRETLSTVRNKEGELIYKKLEITEEDRQKLAFGPDSSGQRLIARLYTVPVPAPSPARGFEESIPYVQGWISELTLSTQQFLDGLEVWHDLKRPLDDKLAKLATERYRSHYTRLAANVPEFLIWASLGEHAATRQSVAVMREDIIAALDGPVGALARLEAILELIPARLDVDRDLCRTLHRSNRGFLEDSILPEAASVDQDTLVTFPTIGRIYLNPRYQVGVVTDGASPADETWWKDKRTLADLDLRLAGFLASAEATNLPLLLLGHPGAGKSLLTQVIAARLPESGFTTVRVPLRRVDAGAPIYLQIQQALDSATHGRIEWSELAEQSMSTVRVVLLDGLDELLQAAGYRGNYLQEVMEFQRREADQERPVAVIVTSRTVVADRVIIPAGTTVIRLQGFDQAQVESWLDTWNAVNAPAISSGRVRGLTLETALRQPELASQPLLLLMLALYSADPVTPAIDSGISSAVFYRRILQFFIRREIAKSPEVVSSADMDGAIYDQIWRLSVAAFAMFNRGRQDISDIELGTDLAALSESAPGIVHFAEIGQRLLGKFFFVYLTEGQSGYLRDNRKSYEFLHATFAEYLMAGYTVSILSDMAQMLVSGTRGSRGPDDDLLHALLSHQPLAIRKSTLTFAAELFGEFSNEKQSRILEVLDALLVRWRQRRHFDSYSKYEPRSADRVKQLAAYSSNLVLLRIMLETGDAGIRISQIWPGDSAEIWRSNVSLWRSGLDTDGFQSLLSTIVYDNGLLRRSRDDEAMSTEWVDMLQARLAGDPDAENRVRLGMTIHDGLLYSFPTNSWDEVLYGAFMSLVSSEDEGPSAQLTFDPSTTGTARSQALATATRLLILFSHEFSFEAVSRCVKWMLSTLPTENPRLSYGLAAAICAHPRLLDKIPELNDPELYEAAAPIMMMISPERLNARLMSLRTDIIMRYDTSYAEDAQNKYKFDHRQIELLRQVMDAYRLPGPG